MKKLREPFFGVNTKSYMYGKKLVEFAKQLDQLAEKYDIDITISASYVDLPQIARETKHLILSAQGMDVAEAGKGMGLVLPEGLAEAGVDAVFLNHAACPMTTAELVKAVKRAKEVGLLTTVCADSKEEIAMVASLKPDSITCEQAALIGTGVMSDKEYMIETKKLIHSISPDTLVVQGAGIKNGDDCYKCIMNGSAGAGGSSGVMCAPDPIAAAEEMIQAILRAKHDLAQQKAE